MTSTLRAGSFAPDKMIEMRKRIDRGQQIGPRIFNSGPYFGPARPGWDPEMDVDTSLSACGYFGEIFKIKLKTAKASCDAGGVELLTVGADHNSGGAGQRSCGSS